MAKKNKKSAKNQKTDGASMFFHRANFKTINKHCMDPSQPKTIFNFLRELNVKAESQLIGTSLVYELESMTLTENDNKPKQNEITAVTEPPRRIKILVPPKIEFEGGKYFLTTFYGFFLMPNKTDVVKVLLLNNLDETSDKFTVAIMLKNGQSVYVNVIRMERSSVIECINNWLYK